MSFRNRLALFFVVIVIVPMVSVAIVLFRLISDSENGKSDAGIAAAQRSATELYRLDASGSRAQGVIAGVQADGTLALALEHGDRATAQRRVVALRRSTRAARIEILLASQVFVDSGDPTAVAPVIRDLVGPTGKPLGRLELSLHNAASYAALVRRVTGLDVLISSDGGVLASTLPGARPSAATNVAIAGRSFRVRSFPATGFAARPLQVEVLASRGATASSVSHGRLLAALVLVGFFLLAVAFALLVSRSLQAQIASFLEAARRLGSGDFDARVPVVGHDEFAMLGGQFNEMSKQLETRLEELDLQRKRLERSLQRIGETFASNLDRDALLGIVLRTAVDGVGAIAGRASVRASIGEPLRESTRVGDVSEVRQALHAAEATALAGHEPSQEQVDSVTALAHPLMSADGVDRVFGVISVARRGRAFDVGERELFDYLARQAAVSVENVGLHEQVQLQAVTDELTGLFNHRRFYEALSSEVERARRFDLSVGLIMLDLDDFKEINDNYGHQQGDRVLRGVADLLREYSREVDAPARYGGEELAIVLPQTDLDGAFQLAERVRAGIEAMDVPLIGREDSITVTASIGVAALPVSARDAERLVAAADAALYKAKRAGKNRTVRAQ